MSIHPDVPAAAGEQPLLVSHVLCPYVQRAVIALTEKKVPFQRIDIDLADKPAWFRAISPLGRTPVLRVGEVAVFESAVILEYLDETASPQLHPADPLQRADHRAWMAYGSQVLDDIAGLYNAPDAAAFEAKRARLAERLATLEGRVKAGPWFDGEAFSLVDAVFGPVFRYFDTFDRILDHGILDGLERVARWRSNLADRPSITGAVAPDYPARLMAFLRAKDSHLGRLAAAPLREEAAVTGDGW